MIGIWCRRPWLNDLQWIVSITSKLKQIFETQRRRGHRAIAQRVHKSFCFPGASVFFNNGMNTSGPTRLWRVRLRNWDFMAETRQIWRFTPSRTEPAVLETIFVQRQNLLTDTLEQIRASATTGDKHHLLFVGPRGIGKTHLLSLIRHRVNADATLRDRLRVAWLNEDETSTSFLELLVRIYRALSAGYPTQFPEQHLQETFNRQAADGQRYLEQQLLQCLDENTLLLLVENLDELFKGLGDAGQKAWRAFLQEHPVACQIATSQSLFAAISRRATPFFGFFSVHHLQPLTVTEAQVLLLKIAQQAGNETLVAYLRTPEGRSRVRALHHLAGGNHRVYVVLAEFIDRDSLDELVGPFEEMVDGLTPYYQERLRWLAPQQRRIIELLCTQKEPLAVKEISRQLFSKEQTIASQLKKLKQLGYVNSSPRGRESLYELTEPLMRLSFEVKENQREPLRLIVDFLRVWYRPEQLQTKLAQAITSSSPAQTHLQAAVTRGGQSDLRLEMLERDISTAQETQSWDEVVSAMEERAHVRGTANDWFELGNAQDEVRRFADAVSSYDKALAIDSLQAYVWNNRGNSLADMNRQVEALESYDKALALIQDDAFLWNNRGNLLFNMRRYADALDSCDHAIALDPNLEASWNNRGNALYQMGRYTEALDSYDRAVAIAADFALAWNNRGSALESLGRYQEAFESYDISLTINPADADAWNNRGTALFKLGRIPEALQDYQQALLLDPQNCGAWNNQGDALLNTGHFVEALESLDKAIVLDPLGAFPHMNRVEALLGLRRWEEAFSALKMALASTWPNPESHAGDIVGMLKAILAGSEDVTVRRERVARLVDHYRDAGLISYFAEGLVRSLKFWKSTMFNHQVLEDWRRLWLELQPQYPGLELAIRIFDAGSRYLMTNDERVLLDLIATEREIARQALGLVAERSPE